MHRSPSSGGDGRHGRARSARRLLLNQVCALRRSIRDDGVRDFLDGSLDFLEECCHPFLGLALFELFVLHLA